MLENSRDEVADREAPEVDGGWDTCPNVSTVCPGCLTRFEACAGGVHTCACTDVLWRSHPLARPSERVWQVVFLDDVPCC